jgi:hypothetical protein
MSRARKDWNTTPAEKEARHFKYQDLQRACIVRGIDFTILVNGTHPFLVDWFIRHYNDKFDATRLDAFDKWREEVMLSKGKNEPFIRLGFVGEQDPETGDIISIKKPKKFKKPKKGKRERDTKFNIFTGTKKELTFRCQSEGKTIEETIKTVKAKFPDAVDKSISIWYKKAKKLQTP